VLPCMAGKPAQGVNLGLNLDDLLQDVHGLLLDDFFSQAALGLIPYKNDGILGMGETVLQMG
ncbi:hypothetical protein, partial [Desulfosoma sp.]|uniref:hypothetical protein n=1 Tax=Desulfosoma sp. TaxID=2603217 RepID=UPI00404A12FD